MATPDGNAQLLVEACAGLARTYYAEDPAAAARYAQRAVALPSTVGPTPTIAELAAGWVALCSGDIQSAAGYAARVRAEAGRSRDAAGLAEAIELAALAAHRSQPQPAARGTLRRCLASLVEAAAIWAELGNEYALATNASLQARIGGDQLAEDIAAQRLLDLGVQEGAWHMAGPLAVIGPTAIEVEVRTLGHFEVRLAGVPIPAATWQSRKARDLLKLLSGQLGRPAGRDTLAATLWPDAPHEVGMRRLSVLISTVRGLLDPARRHPADRYLITEPSTVQINQAHVVLDAARFAEAARAAIAAEGARLVADRRPPDRPSPAGAWPPADSGARQDADRRLLAGLEAVAARYTGDFCDDGELTGDVIDRSRAALADLFREAVRRLAHRYVQLGRPEAAIGWYLRLTAADRYDEQAHLGLIGALSASGRHGEAARRYRDYLGRMDEIDVKPVAFPLIQPGTAGSPKNS
jgi:DNA-binding SARP family transcriptional activator